MKKKRNKLLKIISKNLKVNKYFNLWKELIKNKNNNNYKILHIKFVKNKGKIFYCYNNLNKSAINFNNNFINKLNFSNNFPNKNPLFKSSEEIQNIKNKKFKKLLFNKKLKIYFNKWKNFIIIKSKKFLKRQFTKYFLMYLINTFTPFNFENNNYILGKYSYLWYYNINKK